MGVGVSVKYANPQSRRQRPRSAPQRSTTTVEEILLVAPAGLLKSTR